MANKLDAAYESVKDDIDAVEAWCTEKYDSYFKSYFEKTLELKHRLEDKDKPITDDELSYIMIDVPLNLIEVSELVSSMRVSQETLKLRNKSDEFKNAEDKMYRELLSSAYNYVINRVEREISFSRELIMGAKKIWDARRRTEIVNPINEDDGNKSGRSLDNYIK